MFLSSYTNTNGSLGEQEMLCVYMLSISFRKHCDEKKKLD